MTELMNWLVGRGQMNLLSREFSLVVQMRGTQALVSRLETASTSAHA